MSREFTRIEDPDREVVGLINRVMDEQSMTMSTLAVKLELGFGGLWEIYRGYRPMSLRVLRTLCHMLNMTDTQVIDICLNQPPRRIRPSKSEEISPADISFGDDPL